MSSLLGPFEKFSPSPERPKAKKIINLEINNEYYFVDVPEFKL